MTLIRYPGSKAKLVRQVLDLFPEEMNLTLWSNHARWEYREPFFGAGAVGLKVLANLSPRAKVWINDIDPGMACLWQTVKDDPKGLCRLVGSFVPSADLFYQFKNEDGRAGLSPTLTGFRKLALHAMSYSGLGFKSGGPLGGKDQENASYPVACRWNPEALREEIMRVHWRLRVFEGLRITMTDFATLIHAAPERCFLYVDPPYYEKGPDLYKHAMQEADHTRLAAALRICQARWVLSYDDHPEVRRLYSWAEIREVNTKYTMARVRTATRPKNMEILITRGD